MALATDPGPDTFRLGFRERQVLLLLGLGHTERQAAAVMGITRDSVRGYLGAVGARCGARPVPCLLATLIRAGMLRPKQRPGDEQVVLDEAGALLVALLAEHGSAKAIAHELGRPVHTVHDALTQLCHTLDARTLNAVVWRAAALGALPATKIGG